jgi:hypothetical protein
VILETSINYIINIPPCARENPVSRQQLMKARNQNMTQHSVVSDWLFPAHRFFSYTGRDIT